MCIRDRHWVRSLSRNTTSGPAPTARRVTGDPLMSTDIQALRAKLQGTRGREYWRSLEAVAETPEFKEYLHREFPQNASEWLDPVGRRGARPRSSGLRVLQPQHPREEG